MTNFLLFLIYLKMPSTPPREKSEDERIAEALAGRFIVDLMGIFSLIVLYFCTMAPDIPIDTLLSAWLTVLSTLWLFFWVVKLIVPEYKLIESVGFLRWHVCHYRFWAILGVLALLIALFNTFMLLLALSVSTDLNLTRAFAAVLLTLIFCIWRARLHYEKIAAELKRNEEEESIMDSEPPVSPEETSQTQEPQPSQNMTASPTIDLTDDQISTHRINRSSQD